MSNLKSISLEHNQEFLQEEGSKVLFDTYIDSDYGVEWAM